jgi:hypothetical protein
MVYYVNIFLNISLVFCAPVVYNFQLCRCTYRAEDLSSRRRFNNCSSGSRGRHLSSGAHQSSIAQANPAYIMACICLSGQLVSACRSRVCPCSHAYKFFCALQVCGLGTPQPSPRVRDLTRDITSLTPDPFLYRASLKWMVHKRIFQLF